MTSLAGALLPYRAKALYEASPGAQYKIGGLPLVTVLGVIGAIVGGVMVLMFIFSDTFGLNTPSRADVVIGVLVVSVVWYLLTKTCRSRAASTLRFAFKEIPPNSVNAAISGVATSPDPSRSAASRLLAARRIWHSGRRHHEGNTGDAAMNLNSGPASGGDSAEFLIAEARRILGRCRRPRPAPNGVRGGAEFAVPGSALWPAAAGVFTTSTSSLTNARPSRFSSC